MKPLLVSIAGLLMIAQHAFCQETPKELIDSGYSSYDQGDYEQAIRYFDQAEKMDDTNPELFYLRGVCKSLIDHNEAAIRDFERAIEIDADFAEAYFEKGYSYFMLNNAEKSIESYTEAIEIDPDYGEAYQNRGAVKCMNDDPEGAKKDWERAKDLGVMVPEMGC